MSLDISLEKQFDPFSRGYEQCSKCGGRLGLRVTSNPVGGQTTSQICRNCGHEIVTAKINIVRIK